MEDKDYNILNQAEQFVNIKSAKMAVQQMKDYVPTIVEMNKSFYNEMKKQGFTDEQAFKFSCEYTIKTLFNNQQ